MNGDLEIEGNLEKAIQSIYKRQDSFLGDSKLQYFKSKWNFSKQKIKMILLIIMILGTISINYGLMKQ